jgi:hypothetical protein
MRSGRAAWRMLSVTTSSARVRLSVVAASVLVAVVSAVAVLVLRVTNSGFEPEGRNWWIVADAVLGLAYPPLGTALAVRGRYALGTAFGVIGACALLSALAAEWHAYNASASGAPVIEHGRLVETVGMSVLVFVAPWVLPWPRGRSPDPTTRWLALGVVAAWTGGIAPSSSPLAICRERTSPDRCYWWRRCR